MALKLCEACRRPLLRVLEMTVAEGEVLPLTYHHTCQSCGTTVGVGLFDMWEVYRQEVYRQAASQGGDHGQQAALPGETMRDQAAVHD